MLVTLFSLLVAGLGPNAVLASDQSLRAHVLADVSARNDFDNTACAVTQDSVQELSFCQPRPHSTVFDYNYGVRDYTVPGNDLCQALATDKCFNIHELKCNGRPHKCLVVHSTQSFVGRARVPKGLKLKHYGKQNCDQGSMFRESVTEHEDWWQGVSRGRNPYGLKAELLDGYKCINGHIVPDQEACKVDIVNSQPRWQIIYTLLDGEERSYTISTGFTTTDSSTNQASFSTSLEQSIEASVGSPGIVETTSTTTFGVTASTMQEISRAFTKSQTEEESRSFSKPGVYWQFVVNLAATNCEKPNYIVRLKDIVRTDNAAITPVCMPNHFVNVDQDVTNCI